MSSPHPVLSEATTPPESPLPKSTSSSRSATPQNTVPPDSTPDGEPVTPQNSASLDLPKIHDTPVFPKPSSIFRNTIRSFIGTAARDNLHEMYAFEMKNKWAELGLSEFMDQFIPGGDLPEDPSRPVAQFDNTKFLGDQSKLNGKKFRCDENALLPELCKVIDSVLECATGSEGQRLVVKDTHGHADKSDHEDYGLHRRPDIVLYPTHEQAKKDYDLSKPTGEGHYGGKTAWAWACLPIEVKAHDDKKPFGFYDDDPFIVDTQEGRRIRGQISEYASKIFQRQPRLFFFMLVVFKNHARIIRWDRVGAVVSTSFDFIAHPEKFHNFVYRYANMDAQRRGYDPTVQLASQEDVDRMRNCQSARTEFLKERLTHALDQPGWPMYKVTVSERDRFRNPSRPESETDGRTGQDKSGTLTFIFGKRTFVSGSPTGRGTKAYVAYDIQTGELVFVKDYWRVDTEAARPEGETYAELHSKEVKFIANPIAVGDVCNDQDGRDVQYTLSQEFLIEERRLVHYRLIVKEVGRPLNDYKSSREMVFAVFCALVAHQQAWTNAGILHRDISDGNILIFEVPGVPITIRGLLIDWDLSKLQKDLDGEASRKSRSGTWQFISALLLMYPGEKQHSVADDLESFMHVLTWLCLRWQRHMLVNQPHQLKTHIMGIYEAYDPQRNGDIGGGTKYQSNTSGRPPVVLTDTNCALWRLLLRLGKLCQEHYAAEDMQKYGGPPTDESSMRDMAADESSAHETDADEDAAAVQLMPPESASQGDIATVGHPWLGTHAAFIQAFTDALRDKRPGAWKKDDKSVDQFKLIGALDTRAPPSSSSKMSGSSSSVKRSLEGDESQDQPARKQSRKSGNSDATHHRAQATPKLPSLREATEHRE